MRNLRALRENEDALQREEIILSRTSTTEESIRQWAGLQMAFEWQLKQTASLFAQDRWNALIELQARLRRLVD